jgi:hypothetical protein
MNNDVLHQHRCNILNASFKLKDLIKTSFHNPHEQALIQWGYN